VAVEVALEGKGAELEGGLQGVFHQLLIKLSSSHIELYGFARTIRNFDYSVPTSHPSSVLFIIL
jgi:hypothetical protein